MATNESPDRQLANRADLIILAREAVANAGGQVAAARVLGVTQASVSRALSKEGGKYEALVRRIVLELAGIEVGREPYFEIRRGKGTYRVRPQTLGKRVSSEKAR
jgi:hypothetical protein